MDRAREALLRAQFKSKGKWYLAQQVDAFLEELSVLVEEDARDGEALSEAMRTLGKENQQLKAQPVCKIPPGGGGIPPPRLSGAGTGT